MKEERLQSAADREEPSGPFSPLSTGPALVERWNLSHFFNNIHTVSTPRSKSSKRLHISLGIEKLRAQAFLFCTQALCIKCIGSPQRPARFSFLENSRDFFSFSLLILNLQPFRFHFHFSKKSEGILFFTFHYSKKVKAIRIFFSRKKSEIRCGV